MQTKLCLFRHNGGAKMHSSLLLENLEIQNVEIHGKGVARHNGRVVFVDNALPGEVVNATIYQKKKGVQFARTTAIHQASESRQQPFCAHYGTCGGCTWQNVSYQKQLDFKRQFVDDAFRRIGKLDVTEIPQVLGCDNTTHYRNKLEFTFSNKRWLTSEEMHNGTEFTPALGFHKPGLFDKVIDVQTCWLQPEPSNKIKNGLREFALKEGIPFFDLRKQEGMLRNLIIRTTTLGETLVIVCFFQNDEAVIKQVMDFLKTSFPEITSLNYVVNTKQNDSIFDQQVICYHGADYIKENLGGLFFQIGPKSFFQVNVPQAKRLFDKAVEYGELKGSETVYDLYCGIGSISLYLAKHCKKVVGVEQLPEAIEDAKKNAALNNIANCEFFAGDVIKVLDEQFVDTHGKPEVIFIDPPRAGVHPKLIEKMLELGPEKIVYVSCNPVTQARDLALLMDRYEITHVQPVDMFPQTYHIENVVGLRRK